VSLLRELADGLWIHEAPLRFMGAPAGRIMNVVRLGDGGLFVHSPAPLADPLRAALDELGEVRFVVAPSRLHGHVSMADYRDAYPAAELLAGPGLPRRRPDLEFAAELGDAPDPRWAPVLDQALFRGNPLLPEAEFLHRPSRTLILADLAMHFGDHSNRTMRAFARVAGMYGRLRATPFFRVTTRRRSAARADLERILAWPFDRVVPGHGAVWESGGRDALRREWAHVLDRRSA
jgi:hypothetical protein